jgi:hypothetical protein
MSTQWAVLTHGPLRRAICPTCSTDSRYEADVYALTDWGVVQVGLFNYCPHCDFHVPDRPKGTDHA